MKKLKKLRAGVEALINHQLEKGTSVLNIAYVLRGMAEELDPRMYETTLYEAAATFDDYVRQHLAKDPPQMEKAKRNIDMATKCLIAVGDTYMPPEGYNPVVSASREPQESDSGLPGSWTASTDAHAILRTIHTAGELSHPVRAIDYQPDARLVVDALIALKLLTQDGVTDLLGITTAGRDMIGIRPEGVLDLPVELAEVTGNIPESELAARFCEGKIAAIDNALTLHKEPELQRQCNWQESYQHVALTLKAMAEEFRAGLHIPSIAPGGYVVPYNEDRSTGISHAASLSTFFEDVYSRNVKAGWWTDITTGEPKKRSVGELFMLMVTELWEAYAAYQNDEADDKLPEYPGLGVEVGDLLIRVADFCGALMAGNIVDYRGVRNPGDEMFQRVGKIAMSYESIRKTPEAVGDAETGLYLPPQNVGLMVDAKLAFNATRADHKIENRLKEDGKRT